jgi:hypothetical protein
MTPVGDIQVEVLLQELEFERMGSQQDTRYFRFKKRPNHHYSNLFSKIENL